MRLTIFKKGLLLVSVPFLYQFLFIGITLLTSTANQQVLFIRTQNTAISEQSKAGSVALKDAQIGSLGFLYSGDPSFLVQNEKACNALKVAIEKMRPIPGESQQVVGDEPDIEEEIDSAGRDAEKLVMQYKADFARWGKVQGEKAKLIPALVEQSKLVEQLSAKLQEVEAEVRKRGSARFDRLQASSSVLRTIYFIGTIVTLLFTLVMGIFYSRRIRGNLAMLVENAKRLQSGQNLIDAMKGNDEINQVDRAFREMAGALTASKLDQQSQSQLLQSILENMSNGVIVSDDRGAFHVFNAEAQRIFGRPEKGLSFEDWLKQKQLFLPDSDLPLTVDQFPMKRALRGERVNDFELRIRGEYDRETWAVIQARPLPSNHRNIRAGLVVIRDITEQRKADLELRRNAAEILELYNSAPCGYHSIDSNGLFLAVNDTELQWLGYKRSELIGTKTFADLLAPESMERYRREFSRFKETGVVTNVEFQMLRKDGSKMPVLLNSTMIRDASGNFLATRSTMFDITERQSAQELIQRYVDVYKSVPIGVTIWRLEEEANPKSLTLVTSNPSASSLLGVALRDFVGKRMCEIFATVTDREFEDYANVVKTGKSIELQDIYFDDERTGQTYWSVKAFSLPDRCVGLAFENITARRNAEEQIRSLNEDLEHRVARRTSELAEVNRDLGQKNQENETFVYSVSHDLRSPLVNLEGFSRELSMIAEEMTALLCEPVISDQSRTRLISLLQVDVEESIRFIQSAVKRLSMIIDSLLRLSRVGRIEYQLQPVDTNAVIQRIVESMNSTITKRHATLAVRELPQILGDPTAVELLFANLIGNALNYLDPKRDGRIEVGCDLENASSSFDGFGVFYVKDTGLGIPVTHQAKIFQAFQRAYPDAAPGEGMGLAIVKRIVERHRGKIWVESQAGVGSTFYVSMPLSFAKAK